MTSYRCARLAVVTVTMAMQAVVAAIGASSADVINLYSVDSRADTVSADAVCTLREAIYAAENAPRNGDCESGFPPEPAPPVAGKSTRSSSAWPARSCSSTGRCPRSPATWRSSGL